jgi:TraB/PrgY/gumN family
MGNAQLMRTLVLGLLLLVNWSVHAEDTLEEVVVTGEQPGPGLWQVKNGDHTLWVIGTHTPLPKKMKWRANEVESLILRAQDVVAASQINAGIGMFGALRLVPAILRARNIPDDGTLSQVLSPELYARWTALMQRYSLSRKVERLRPALAALAMYEKALDSAGLSSKDVVWPVVESAAKHSGVAIRRPEAMVTIKDPKGLINDYAKTDVKSEIGCFEGLVTRMEHDMPRLQIQANAWARGIIAPLRDAADDTLVQRCLDAVMATPRLAAEITEARRKQTLEILLAWEGALQRDHIALAVVPMHELLAKDGPLHEMRQRGYEVIEPLQ